jgi:hypothetical protein
MLSEAVRCLSNGRSSTVISPFLEAPPGVPLVLKSSNEMV